MNKEGMKCAIYVRVSTEMQVDGFSLDAQINTLKRYAEREGMIIVDTYEDAGKSGKSIEGRPSFKKLLDDIKNGLDIKYVLVYKLSRFGRNAADILNSIELIQSYDINLIATEEGIDSSQTSGKLLISVLSAVSEIERENILEQTMNGRREKARQGGWNGGFAPYGYELVNGEFIIIPDEADVVREIYKMFVEENMSANAIAHRLNLQGIGRDLKKNRSLVNWSLSAIKQMLKNPIYKGAIAFGRRKKVKIKGTRDDFARVESDNYILGKGKHEAIISEELWNQAQNKISSRSKKTGDVAYKRVYLLSGLIRCPYCGGKMNAFGYHQNDENGIIKSSMSYKCRNANSETGHHCDNKSRFPMEELDKTIVDFVKKSINKGLFAEKIKAEFASSIDISHLEKEKKQYLHKLNQVTSSKEALENKIDYMPIDTPHREQKLDDYNKRLDELYDVIDEINKNIKDVDKRINGIQNGNKNYDFIMQNLDMFEELFDRMDEVERRKMISMLIKNINIDKETNKVKSIDFQFDIESDDDINENQNINFNLMVDDGLEALPYKEDLVPRYDRKIISQYTDDKGRNVVIFDVNGKQVKAYKYEKGYYYPKEHKVKEPIIKPTRITYAMIQEYVKSKYGLNIHSVYIAEIKRKHGLDMQSYRTIDDARHIYCPPEKANAIEDALKHFNML